RHDESLHCHHNASDSGSSDSSDEEMYDATFDNSSLSLANDAFLEDNDPAEFPFGALHGPLLVPNIDVDPASATESESDASESETETETDNSAGDDGSDSEWEEEDAGNSSDSDDEPWEDDFRPFASKLVATVFILLFGCHCHMSILQSFLWSIFRMLGLMSQLPSLNSVLSMHKKVGGITPVRQTTSLGAEVFVRPAPEIVKRAFSDELLSSRVQQEPKPSPNPTEIYETPTYAQPAPKLCGDKVSMELSSTNIQDFPTWSTEMLAILSIKDLSHCLDTSIIPEDDHGIPQDDLADIKTNDANWPLHYAEIDDLLYEHVPIPKIVNGRRPPVDEFPGTLPQNRSAIQYIKANICDNYKKLIPNDTTMARSVILMLEEQYSMSRSRPEHTTKILGQWLNLKHQPKESIDSFFNR
ncbi:hypothetical protein HDU98_004902, partial [Podochytrium sp. JEL0797]